MSTYVVLYKFTDAGAKNVKGTVQRARESRAENEVSANKSWDKFRAEHQQDQNHPALHVVPLGNRLD